jgi:hypothetical protein
MGHPSTPRFRTFHALRIKGFATIDTMSDMTAQQTADVEEHVDALAADGLALFREARSLWQLTPDGRAAHAEHLALDLAGIDAAAVLHDPYERFLELNTEFKSLCGDWQLRNGEINDHTDAAYDAAVIERLVAIDIRVHPILDEIAAAFDRFQPYSPRLAVSRARVSAGEANMFTGVMCGSYHDAWMELHEDLILSQGIDRSAEGSF